MLEIIFIMNYNNRTWSDDKDETYFHQNCPWYKPRKEKINQVVEKIIYAGKKVNLF